MRVVRRPRCAILAHVLRRAITSSHRSSAPARSASHAASARVAFASIVGRGGITRAPRIGVNAEMARQLVTPAKALVAPRVRAYMRFFAGVCANMAGLVLQAIKGAGTQRTLVGPRDLRLVDSQGVGRSGCLGRSRTCGVRIDHTKAHAAKGQWGDGGGWGNRNL